MNKKSFAFILVFLICILVASVGISSARYQSTVIIAQQIDHAKTIGDISLYDPTSIEGYNDLDNTFRIGALDYIYDNIRFSVKNTCNALSDGEDHTYTNEIDTEFYIRFVQSDLSVASPISFLMYDLDNPDDESREYPIDEETGYYGPFNLPVGGDMDFRFSVKLEWKETKGKLGIHNVQVQMVKKRTDGSYKVIDKADLNLKVNVTVNYYSLGSTELLSKQFLTIEPGEEINFADNANLNRLGVEIPDGYYFSVNGDNPNNYELISYATSGALEWSARYKFNINDDFADNVIEVYLIENNKIPVTIYYYDRSQPKDNSFEQIKSQIIQIDRGVTINFEDLSSLEQLGVHLPENYQYIAAHCNDQELASGNNYYKNSFTIPTDSNFKATFIDVYVAPSGHVKVATQLKNGGTLITTIDTDFGDDGKKTFTQESLRGLNAAFASGTSFEIGIINTETGITCQIGNPFTDGGSVTVDYYNIYQPAVENQLGYCLANPTMCLYIILWW